MIWPPGSFEWRTRTAPSPKQTSRQSVLTPLRELLRHVPSSPSRLAVKLPPPSADTKIRLRPNGQPR